VPGSWVAKLNLSVMVGDFYVRDPRIAIALVCDLFLLVSIWRRRSWRAERNLAFIAIFFLATLVTWELQFSILRYLSFIELISGTLMAAALVRLASSTSVRRLTPIMISSLLVALLAVTVSPRLARSKVSSAAIVSSMPRLPDDALVMISDTSALAYLAMFQPSNIPFVGANNTIVSPGGTSVLDSLVSAKIRNHKGRMWELESPLDGEDRADYTLTVYGLKRIDCMWLTGNLSDSGRVQLCRVVPSQPSDPPTPGNTNRRVRA
jgi:hypothetical protein